MENTSAQPQPSERNGILPGKPQDCRQHGLPIRDALDVLQGKWRMPLLGVLHHQELRFNDLLRELPKITPKVLTSELRYLEQNDLITRNVHPGHSSKVTYALSDYGRTLGKVLMALKEWGTEHRKRMMGRD